MPTSSSFPAWPRRPPLWTTFAGVVSLILTLLFGLITIRSMPPLQASFLPAYLDSAVWSALPPIPSFRKNAPYTHRFVLPHRASITIPPRLLYFELERRIFEGKSIHQLFSHALAAALSTSFFLLVIGLSLDRSHESKSRAG